jgi:2-C-methyl-D-erythritol 4-phosphate cytidylyltransferase
LEVYGKPIILRAVESVWSCTRVSEMIVVVPEAYKERAEQVLAGKEVKVVIGGAERQDSVWAGLQQISTQSRLVMIHDGVRPFASKQMIERVVEAAERSGAAIPCQAIKETIKEIDPKTGKVVCTVDRKTLCAVQTPQVFTRALIMESHQRAQDLGFYATDDAGLVEWLGREVAIVEGEETNLKITTPLDLKLAGIIARDLEK